MLTAAPAAATEAEAPEPSTPSAPAGPAGPRAPPIDAGRIEAGSLPDFGRTIRLPLCGSREALMPLTVPALRAYSARLTQPPAAGATGATASTSARVAMSVAGAGPRLPPRPVAPPGATPGGGQSPPTN